MLNAKLNANCIESASAQGFVQLVLFGYTIVLLVLFGGWSAQAFTHDWYSFAADGLLRRLHLSSNVITSWTTFALLWYRFVLGLVVCYMCLCSVFVGSIPEEYKANVQ